jgi:hypothetical protein
MIQGVRLKGTSNNSKFVTPAKAGVQFFQELMDSCFRRNDIFRGRLKTSDIRLKKEKWQEKGVDYEPEDIGGKSGSG